MEHISLGFVFLVFFCYLGVLIYMAEEVKWEDFKVRHLVILAFSPVVAVGVLAYGVWSFFVLIREVFRRGW